MRRSQPVSSDPRILKVLGIVEETEEQKAAGRQVVKVETVDQMFDFPEYKPNIITRVLRPFRRMKLRLTAARRSLMNYWRWRKLLADYHSLDVYAFLPFFVHHLETYIAGEKKFGISTKECKEYKISTAQETVDILNRLLADDYTDSYTTAIEGKWGTFPYEKTTYADGSTGFKHLTPDEYDTEMSAAYEKATEDEQNDLKRLGELIEKNMPDWWD